MTTLKSNTPLSKDQSDYIVGEFVPHIQSSKYPKLIQKHLARKHSNLNRAIEALRTPSKQFSKKEIRRLSELSKKQQDEFTQMISQSSNRKSQLNEKEIKVKSDLSLKGIDLENPILDIEQIFDLPSKSKRRRHDMGSIISKLSQNSSVIPPQENSQIISMFDPEKSDRSLLSEIDRNLQENDEALSIMPETLFKEISNLNLMTDLEVKETKPSRENDEMSFTEEMYKSDSKSYICDKENDSFMDDDLGEVNEIRPPYVPPSFAKVFGE